MKPESIKFKTIKKADDGSETEFSGSVIYNLPESLEEATQAWGSAVVLNKALSSVVIEIQGICRRADSVDEAQSTIDKWVPGIVARGTRGGVSKKELYESLKGMTAEDMDELKKFMASLKAA